MLYYGINIVLNVHGRGIGRDSTVGFASHEVFFDCPLVHCPVSFLPYVSSDRMLGDLFLFSLYWATPSIRTGNIRCPQVKT